MVAKFATPNSDGSYEMYSSPDVINYLNSGGSLDQLEKNPRGTSWEKIVDLTGDGFNEIVYRDIPGYAILGCKDGQYQDLFDFVGEFGTNLADILDLNKDGIPEPIFYDISHYGYADVYIFEWGGNKFRSLINLGTDTFIGKVIDSVSATSPHRLTDANGDRLKDIIVVYNVKELCNGFRGLDFCDGTPTREQTVVLGWNGQNYVDLKQENYATPEYRF